MTVRLSTEFLEALAVKTVALWCCTHFRRMLSESRSARTTLHAVSQTLSLFWSTRPYLYSKTSFSSALPTT
jgi:hypothetical protein